MSLLPIIYSSIFIFGGILVFVVIVSYVSFKVNGTESSEKEPDKGDNTKKVQRKKPEIDLENLSESEQYNISLKENFLIDKKLKSSSNKSHKKEEEIKKKVKDKNFQVMYKEEDLFNRSRPRVDEPRFSVIKDISEHLEKFDNNSQEESSNSNLHLARKNREDYLRYYDNY